MKVYVSGSSQELDRASDAMAAVRGLGMEVAHDWVASILKHKAANRGLSEHVRLSASLEALSAARGADLFWLLLPEAPTIGAWVELGAFSSKWTHGLIGKIFISGGDMDRTIFTSLAHVGEPDDAAIVPHLERLMLRIKG